jgi:hypothetical protein
MPMFASRGAYVGKPLHICFDRNVPALRLYASLGFREMDRRAIVPHPSLHYSDGNALLLVRECTAREQVEG